MSQAALARLTVIVGDHNICVEVTRQHHEYFDGPKFVVRTDLLFNVLVYEEDRIVGEYIGGDMVAAEHVIRKGSGESSATSNKILQSVLSMAHFACGLPSAQST